MKDLTKYYIDLSKCTEEQRKHIFSLLPECCGNGQYVYNAEFAKHLKYNSYHQSWVTGLFSNDKRLKELTYPEFIKLFEGGGEGEKKVKIVFGLEAQGHIPIIEAELKRWNDSFNADYPDHKTKDTMTYSKDVWESIGKKIGWCPFTASLAYFNWLKNKD